MVRELTIHEFLLLKIGEALDDPSSPLREAETGNVRADTLANSLEGVDGHSAADYAYAIRDLRDSGFVSDLGRLRLTEAGAERVTRLGSGRTEMPYGLEREQVELLCGMVDALLTLPREKREPILWTDSSGGGFLLHPYGAIREGPVLLSDLETLREQGLVRMRSNGAGGYLIDITPKGSRFRAQQVENVADAVAHIEDAPRRRLGGEAFKAAYPEAFAKWSQAQQLLYAANVDDNLTLVGHLCTEAIQAFATALVDRHKPHDVTTNPSYYIKRLDAVIDLFKPRVGEARADLLYALVNYWAKAAALAERQEHGQGKAGDPVTWEDAERVVHHTANVMFEIDRTLANVGRG